MTKILETIKHRRLIFDGGTGTVLQKRGLLSGEPPEIMNRKGRDAVLELHLEYLRAGADIIKTNTFGINSLKYKNVEEELSLGFDIAREAVSLSGLEAYIAFDVGPTGRMLKPFGDLDFEDAVEVFAKNMRLADKLGADLILIETMSDMYETKAAVIAARENSSLPVFVTCAFGADGKLMTGADAAAMVAMLEGLGVSALGVNCSVGPAGMTRIVEELLLHSSLPVIVNPNAGLPRVENGEGVYDLSADDFACEMAKICELGAHIVGGCCGTTPLYIERMKGRIRDIEYTQPTLKDELLISSYTHAVTIGADPKIVGERINPTGKARLKTALREGDVSYLLSLAISQQESGAHILDVNVGLADIDEYKAMTEAVKEIQAVVDLPLQIDTGNPEVMEAAMRIYCGKPLVNSVTGSYESMDKIFPIVKKYGGAVIALTMDENGIPDTSEGRVMIADKIVACAEKYGVSKRELIFDPLALTVASDSRNAKITLEAVKLLKAKGYKCSLGVSNVSFGLPGRDVINSAFYSSLLAHGLDLAIINPESESMMGAYHSHLALMGYDGGCAEYIARFSNIAGEVASPVNNVGDLPSLAYAIEKGLKDRAAEICRLALCDSAGMDIINEQIIPALNRVGELYDEKKLYLPNLLMSAEAANAAFAVIRESTPVRELDSGRRVVLATVKGDIHDIGKNIVKLIFESYGYSVTDLGRDVDKQDVLSALIATGARVLGLSALMTTTLPAMEDTVKLIKEKLPHVKIMVGGAVLTQTYADRIGADYYAPDALSGVRLLEETFS